MKSRCLSHSKRARGQSVEPLSAAMAVALSCCTAELPVLHDRQQGKLHLMQQFMLCRAGAYTKLQL